MGAANTENWVIDIDIFHRRGFVSERTPTVAYEPTKKGMDGIYVHPQ